MSTDIRNAFLATLAENRLEAKFADNDHILWNHVLEDVSYVPTNYTWSLMDFYRLLARSKSMRFVDGSIILLKDTRAVAVWPIHFSYSEEKWKAEQFEGCVVPPLFISRLSSKIKKELSTQLVKALNQLLAKEFNLNQWRCQELLIESSSLSPWHRQLMVNQGKPTLRHQLFVDLRLSTEEIKSGLRKSYKSLVNSGLKLWKCEISSPVLQFDRWEELRLLHQSVAGRVTRGLETWNAQYTAIKLGEAFAIFLRDQADKMVGGAFFHISRTEGLYVVAAYDRSLFDLPLGHVVQHLAIEEMKRRNLTWYRIGYRPYPQENSAPTAKELSIGHFKEGFSTHVFPEIITVLDIDRCEGKQDEGQ